MQVYYTPPNLQGTMSEKPADVDLHCFQSNQQKKKILSVHAMEWSGEQCNEMEWIVDVTRRLRSNVSTHSFSAYY